MAMTRTTIMADEKLLDELREIARTEGISLGEVIRQGLEWRAKTRRRVPSFLSKPLPATGKPSNVARTADDDIAEYIRKKFARH